MASTEIVEWKSAEGLPPWVLISNRGDIKLAPHPFIQVNRAGKVVEEWTTEKLLKPWTAGRGYRCVSIRVNGKLKQVNVDVAWRRTWGLPQKPKPVPDHRVPIQAFDLDGKLFKEWPAIIDAVKEGYTMSAIYRCLAGDQEIHRNLKWKRVHAKRS